MSDMAELFKRAHDVAAAGLAPRRLDTQQSYTVIPEDMVLHVFEDEYPNHVSQAVENIDAESFAAYVNMFKGKQGNNAVLFADLGNLVSRSVMGVTAVLDYHNPDGEETIARHCRHRAVFTPQLSEQYARWRAIDDKAMSQEAFAAFIEEFANDIDTPAPATMLEVASDLEMTCGMVYKSRTNTQNGMSSFAFEETGKAVTKGGVEVPKQFSLKLPLFFGEAPVEIPVFLRFRASKGEPLQFLVKIRDRETREQNAFLQTVNRISELTQLTPLLGRCR